MAGFLFRLETADGEPASPSTLQAAVPNWNEGECIYLGPGRSEWSAGETTTPINRRCSSSRRWPNERLGGSVLPLGELGRLSRLSVDTRRGPANRRAA
jgi:hypothetical protein